MNRRLMILCSGQGGQHAGMFDLARSDSQGAAALARSGVSIDADTLFDNEHAQPAIVAAALSTWATLRDRVPVPSLVAGYSIGELAAYGVAGALSIDVAVSLARLRANAMDACVLQPHALAAIGGLPIKALAALANAHHFELSIVTGGDSCIVGGLQAHAASLELAVNAAAGRFQRLPVAVASHTALIAEAIPLFAAGLDAAPFTPQLCPVLSGVAATPIDGKAAAIDHLSRQLAHTIQWADCMDTAAEMGINVALELGPGAALSRMLSERHPAIACRSVSDFRSVDGVIKWLERELD
ncbi:MAG: acyltransferase domain-containing protein [Massilia sp.]